MLRRYLAWQMDLKEAVAAIVAEAKGKKRFTCKQCKKVKLEKPSDMLDDGAYVCSKCSDEQIAKDNRKTQNEGHVGHTSDPIVDGASEALANELMRAVDNEQFVAVATEVMLGVADGHEHDKLTLARYEDVEHTAELIVQAVYRDPELHDQLHRVAAALLRNAMRTAEPREV